MDTVELIRKHVRCSGCQGSLVASRHVNLVAHRLRATWAHPTRGNVLSCTDGEAVSVVCDLCIETEQPIAEAVQFVDLPHGQVAYHVLTELEELPPKPTFVIHPGAADGRPAAIECLMCGMTSYNPNDVQQKYCGHCKQFHTQMMEARRGCHD